VFDRVGDEADVAGADPGAFGADEEDEVAWLFLAAWDLGGGVPLVGGDAWDGDSCGSVGLLGEAGAVEGVGAFGSPDVGLAELAAGEGDDLGGEFGGCSRGFCRLAVLLLSWRTVGARLEGCEGRSCDRLGEALAA
jgi:hypothetical protein